MGDPGEDARFSKLGTEKRFRRAGKKHSKKVKIDSRFQGLFTQEKFVSKCAVDKRGKPRHLTAKEDYAKFYDLDSSEEEDDEKEKVKAKPSKKKEVAKKKRDNTSEEDSDTEDERVPEGSEESEDDGAREGKAAELEPEIVAKLRDDSVDYARGEGRLYSDSSSGEDDTSEDEAAVAEAEAEAEVFDKWGEMDRDAETTEEETKRLAVCNMDWDRVGAADLFLVLSSFCPASGTVTSVEVFLSDFGKERLEEEARLGPAELRVAQGDGDEAGDPEAKSGNGDVSDEDDDDDDEEDERLLPNPRKEKAAEMAAMARVRQYQVNRLKYYYAVAEFDSEETASRVYSECDGMEYELSATRFDLRYIPDDMTFSTPATDSCTATPDPSKYQPKIFQTTALQQQKVELTWDETDPNRGKAMKRAFEVEGDEMEEVARDLIAPPSDEEDSDEENTEQDGAGDGGGVERDSISKFRSLLADIQDKEARGKVSEGDMEITWKDGGEGDSMEEEEEEEEQPKEELGPWQKYLQKKKDKKKERRKVKEKKTDALVSDEEGIPDGVDMNDPFFAEEFGDEFKNAEDSDKKSKKKKNKKKLDEEDQLGNDAENNGLGLMIMDSDDEKNHFNFKDIVEKETKSGKSKKWKKKKKEASKPVEDTFAVDVADERFGALFNRAEFNIDPTESNFKKTKNMEKIIAEKMKRIESSTQIKARGNSEPLAKKSKLDADTSLALKAVKNKWKQNSKNKKGKLKFSVRDA